MAEHSHPAAHCGAVERQVAPEDRPLTALQGHQPGTQPQQGGLARSVGTAQEQDLAARHRQRRPGEGRETAQYRHGVAEVDDGIHG